MKLACENHNLSSHAPGSRSGFTMIEIGICLAVIAFALVAIVGVLPLGMNVQRENREQTIIGQDGAVLIDAIRSGARGMDDLTNYVLVISNYIYKFDANSNLVPGGASIISYAPNDYVTNGTRPGPPNNRFLTNGADIIGLLSMPKYIPIDNGTNGFYSNYVFADFRAMSGPVSEKFPQRDSNILNYAFGYRVFSEVVSIPTYEGTSQLSMTFRTNLHDLRLSFRWPLIPNGVNGSLGYSVGGNRQVFRTQIAGRIVVYTNENRPLYFFDTKNFAFVPPL